MKLTLTFTPERKDDLERLQSATGASLQDVVNNALSVFEWAVAEAKAQNQIASVNEREHSYRVVNNPLLQKVAASAQQEKRKEVA